MDPLVGCVSAVELFCVSPKCMLMELVASHSPRSLSPLPQASKLVGLAEHLIWLDAVGNDAYSVQSCISLNLSVRCN